MRNGRPHRLSREGSDILAIPIGIQNELALTRFSGLRTIPGWLVVEEEIREWFIEGFFQSEKKYYLYGPYYDGFLLEEVLDYSPEQTLVYLLNLLNSLFLLEKRGIRIDHLQTDSVLFLKRGGILFLPPDMMKRILETRPLSYRLEVYEKLRHPDLREGEKRLSYTLAVLLYRNLTGQFPFNADSDEEVRNQARNLRLPPLTRYRPEIKEEVSGFILRCLDLEQGPPPSLEEWRSLLHEWRQNGLFESLLDTERERRREQAAEIERKLWKSYRRRIYWQRNWKTFAAAGAAVLIAVVVLGSITKKIMAPPSTKGYSPQEVVETFYLSINELDHTRMEDCVIGNAGKEIINEVIRLYVTSRITLGYEGKSFLIPADEWIKMGKPELVPPQSVFGVTELDIRELEREPPVFEAKYKKWIPIAYEGEKQPPEAGEPEPPATGPPYQTFHITERLYLKQHRDVWVIYRIERLNLEPLSP